VTGRAEVHAHYFAGRAGQPGQNEPVPANHAQARGRLPRTRLCLPGASATTSGKLSPRLPLSSLVVLRVCVCSKVRWVGVTCGHVAVGADSRPRRHDGYHEVGWRDRRYLVLQRRRGAARRQEPHCQRLRSLPTAHRFVSAAYSCKSRKACLVTGCDWLIGKNDFFRCVIDKQTPLEGGMGGGSSNCATAMWAGAASPRALISQLA
jgi:hypothetical protein